ncbi:FUSC family protein [Kribbella sp. NPDC006257]|uniref:FUSC family protein n=1 Tax=Kribbella sp. NPDC006257 TaxID=3156738 RepID=UPI0033AEBD2C
MAGVGSVLGWLRAKDAGLSATRRAARAAVVMPAVFAFASLVIGNPVIGIFASFGSMAMVLFVDFTGSMTERLQAQVSLMAAGVVLITIGTLASGSAWIAALVTLVVVFVVLFVGVISSVLASATTALLAAFILPVTLAGPLSSLPDRLLGWLLAGAASLVAITLLWPAPTREPLRDPTAHACALIAKRLRAGLACLRDGPDPAQTEALITSIDEASDAVAALRKSFFGTPYRPTGLSTSARTLVRVVDEVIWLETVLQRHLRVPEPGPVNAQLAEVFESAAVVLERAAELLGSGGDLQLFATAVDRLKRARVALEETVTALLPATNAASGKVVTAFVSGVEPIFRAQEMSFAITAIAENIQLAVAARGRSWWQTLLGGAPTGIGSPLSSVQERAGAHVERHSVWLHNSIRGAVGLALAVLVADLAGVQHSFWVVFGTLAVLRSNALSTGQNALRGLLGTVAGIIIGGGLVVAIGTDTTVAWLLLPIAVALAGLAPAAFSFAAGQAAFTATLLILFDIISPAGWEIGLVRIEDVAIGSAVSLLVGVLFWPRGASSALRQALAEAYSDSAHYLRQTVEYAVNRCDGHSPPVAEPFEEGRRAAAAARRLDDAFRTYLAERGAKHLPLADVTTLVSGVAVLRITGDAILELWNSGDRNPAGDRTAARTELLETAGALVEWYQQTAVALASAGTLPAQVLRDSDGEERLLTAVRQDLTDDDGRWTGTAVRMLWTADHLDAVRRLQVAVAETSGSTVAG